MRRVVMGIVMMVLVGCGASTATPKPRATPPSPADPCAGVTIWGCGAHKEVAASTDCADLQSWFDSADAQRAVLLQKKGVDDPDYRYAFDVMKQADDRMRSIGCYG